MSRLGCAIELAVSIAVKDEGERECGTPWAHEEDIAPPEAGRV